MVSFVSEQRFPMFLTIISIAMAVLWAETFTTGDDDLFWARVIVSPIFLILFSHNFVFFNGKKQKTASFFLSFFAFKSLIIAYVFIDPFLFLAAFLYYF